MELWQVITGANLAIAAAYFSISGIILTGLARTGQLNSNRLGLATGLIFMTCAVHHGSHSIHMLLPTFGVADPQALAMRESWHWPTGFWDIFSAGVAFFYLSQRNAYMGLLANVSMFEDLRARERQALEINDNIVQGLTQVKWALESGREDEAGDAADRTLQQAQQMVTDLLLARSPEGTLEAGRLRREAPADMTPV